MPERKNYGKISLYFLPILIVGFLIFTSKESDKNEDSLRLHSSFIGGTITHISSSKGTNYIVYRYTINNVNYEGSTDDEKHLNGAEADNLFQGKDFPVLYDNTNVGYSHMLIFPNQFKKYNVPYPDSLRWVIKYVNNY